MAFLRRFLLGISCVPGLAAPASAARLLYDFEGDSGTSVSDKLTGDGAQNAVTYNSVDPASTFSPAFGSQSAFFDNPPPLATGSYTTIEMPDSTLPANFSLTLAGWVKQDIINTDLRRFRVFSSFTGTGGVPNNVLMLDAGNAATTSSVRGIVGGIQFSGSFPALASGYHHYAMTVDGSVSGSSAVKLYVNGSLVNTTASGTLSTYSNNVNLRVGEDVNMFPQQNSANEQIVGNVDDVLMLSRTLSAADISSIYNAGLGAPISNVVTPAAGERAIYYDFEGATGNSVIDKFATDGGQNGIVTQTGVIDTVAANAKLGESSFSFTDPQPPTTPGSQIYSQINAGPIGALGPNFTLSAVVNPLSSGQFLNGIARIFSSYQGTGSTAGSLILDFNPLTATGIRLFLPSNTGAATLTAPGPGLPDLAADTQQTITVVYEAGAVNDSVKLFVNGSLVASKLDLPPGTVQTLGTNDLRIGEDRGGYRGAFANENYIGTMDDILILDQALTTQQVLDLHTNGAAALVASLAKPGDYTGDGKVDGADFLAWQRGFGTAVTPGSGADGDGSGTIDAADLLVWKNNFGGSTVAASAAIPEPSAVALALPAIAAGVAARKRRHPQPS